MEATNKPLRPGIDYGVEEVPPGPLRDEIREELKGKGTFIREIVVDRAAIHEEQKKSLIRKTIRVQSQLP